MTFKAANQVGRWILFVDRANSRSCLHIFCDCFQTPKDVDHLAKNINTRDKDKRQVCVCFVVEMNFTWVMVVSLLRPLDAWES